MRNLLRPQALYIIEAALIGVFFVQALRFLIAMLYSRIASASLYLAVNPANIPTDMTGIVEPQVISNELFFLVYMVALPLLTIIIGRIRWFIIAAVIITAAGRALMNAETNITSTTAAALTLGGALLYIALIIRHRAQTLPYLFVFGIGIDQIFRAYGNTLDPSWSPAYFNIQIILSIIAVILSLLTVVSQQRAARIEPNTVNADNGIMPLWGGLGMGALLFLELSLLGLPNAVAGRANIDYTTFVPLIIAATFAPLIPFIQRSARSFIALFDGSVRGWAWLLLVALLIVFGTRFQGVIAGAALVAAQFTVSMMWWWLTRPQAERERNFSGLWLVFTVAVFSILVIADSFTYEYAYVRNFVGDLAFLNNFVTPLLRGFRGLGLGVLLLAVLIGALPMIQTTRRIPWTTGSLLQSLLAILFVAGCAALGAYYARPPIIAGERNVDYIRIGTYNIHGGYNEFYDLNLEAVAQTIQQSGATVVLLQEVETGRMTSFGVDQALWLARRLGMDTRFYPTNEGLQGLAVLSKVEIVFDDGSLLTSIGNQTGLQRVQIRPDTGVITLYNTWLGLLLDTGEDRSIEEQEQDQQTQLNEIFALISSHHPDGVLGRTIFGGTFNNVPDSPLIDQIRSVGFVDTFAGLPPELSTTLQRIGLRARLDYLWIRPPLLLCSAGVMDDMASDHRMAVVEVSISGQGICPTS
jgi:endonuclease/exonuclease/phosphatase family metal-dependent hydrolase